MQRIRIRNSRFTSIASRFGFGRLVLGLATIALLIPTSSASALDIDWSGQFRADWHLLGNYSMTPGNVEADPTGTAAGGYYVPGGGEKLANFQSLFMRLRPSVIVNDNIYLKTELWLGDPVYGVFGDSLPATRDRRFFNTTFSAGSPISAQRFWGEFLTDIGTFQVGRMPLDWGLGIVWNSGEDVWSRYMSTGDGIRMVSKIGPFAIAPSYIRYSSGNSVGGVCADPTGSGSLGTGNSAVCRTSEGSSTVTDISIVLQYENIDDETEVGVNYIRRLGFSPGTNGILGFRGNPDSANYNIIDIFARKSFGWVTVAAEVPIVTGEVSGTNHNTVAAALEVDVKPSDRLSFDFKAGYAPGQGNVNAGTNSPDNFTAFFFHPEYRPGNLLFNYQFRNFAGPNTNLASGNTNQLVSVFDAPIVNAIYGSIGGGYRIGRWRPYGSFLAAFAPETAAQGRGFYNHIERRFVNSATDNQSGFLGYEFDFGVEFFWDDFFTAGLDMGIFVPGPFWEFTNSTTVADPLPVMGGVLRLGVVF
jgi:hypothetical protein